MPHPETPGRLMPSPWLFLPIVPSPVISLLASKGDSAVVSCTVQRSAWDQAKTRLWLNPHLCLTFFPASSQGPPWLLYRFPRRALPQCTTGTKSPLQASLGNPETWECLWLRPLWGSKGRIHMKCLPMPGCSMCSVHGLRYPPPLHHYYCNHSSGIGGASKADKSWGQSCI